MEIEYISPLAIKGRIADLQSRRLKIFRHRDSITNGDHSSGQVRQQDLRIKKIDATLAGLYKKQIALDELEPDAPYWDDYKDYE